VRSFAIRMSTIGSLYLMIQKRRRNRLSIRKRILSAILTIAILLLTACSAVEDLAPEPVDDYQEVEVIEEIGDEIEVEVIEEIDDEIEDEAEESEPVSLEDFIADALEAHSDRIKGVAFTAFTGDDIILELLYGYADTEAGIEIDSDSVFQWGSITKLLVYVSAMQLYERGELDLHADIFTYIPGSDFPNIQVPITMHHLINHTPGFAPHTDSDDIWYSLLVQSILETYYFITIGDDIPTLGGSLRSVFTQFPQVWQPGEVVEYADLFVGLAAYVVERIAGVPFYQYVHENIFAPLGMYHTAILPDLSDNAWVDEQRDVMIGYGQFGPLYPQRRLIANYPAGMAAGTISDMMKFARALMPDENGVSILFENPETLFILYPTLEEIQDINECTVGFRFFNGFMVFSVGEPIRVLGHGGGVGGFVSGLFIEIDRGIGFVISENTSFGLQSMSTFTDGLYEVVFAE